eukprot:TRINITY_DN3297_c0_g1_i1.p2 TRINITY_DN3297_c0_g1~~TRINITY_DN3297_c0_g1_i1.p2  ORF type:complete len:143 (-),score=39.83 TRINITY_DN3297_c0_g1_i1:142-570(-)
MITYRSVEQQYSFNFPFQLAHEEKYGEKVDNAQASFFVAKEGDLVLLGTDGLFDNVWDHEILNFFSRFDKIKKGKDEKGVFFGGEGEEKELAKELGIWARELSQKGNRVSPFAAHASRDGMSYMGGKPDDITIVIARVLCAV